CLQRACRARPGQGGEMYRDTSSTTCLECGGTLEGAPLEGLCPRCLMRRAMQTTEATSGARGFVAPTPEELAPHFPQLEILELVGHGGMGAVYKARQPALDRWVALKILAPALSDSPAFAERFNREARAMARLAHRNIVSIHDFGRAGGFSYL